MEFDPKTVLNYYKRRRLVLSIYCHFTCVTLANHIPPRGPIPQPQFAKIPLNLPSNDTYTLRPYNVARREWDYKNNHKNI